MATHYHLPIFHPLFSRELTLSSQFPLPYSHINHRHSRRYSTILALSSKKSPPRASRKLKSDADLCNDIREFISTLGLPENHVPTTKELSNHGRQDLANLVRRRGYKLIRQLLETSVENCIRPIIDTGQTGNVEVLSGSGGPNEKLKVLSIDVLSNESLQDDNLCIETDEELQLNLNDQSSDDAESNTLSLQEQVAKFIKHGKLDTIEAEDEVPLDDRIDSEFGSMYEQHSDEEGKNTESETSREPESALSILNGNVSSSAQKIEDPLLENSISRNDEDLEDENEDEIMHLKLLLHQKEFELTQLKQQIEKEKHALSLLQTKAEKEIIKAQELISEKETELQAAEETLSGLKEVEIQYSGDGETVELAGSFNGWHHRIQMDPQLSLSPTGSSGSRISRIWRAVLWLYPGVYEIKFIIDGHWRIDPQTESITRNGVHNNILRVEDG